MVLCYSSPNGQVDIGLYYLQPLTLINPRSSSNSYSVRTLDKWNVSQPQDSLSALAGKVIKRYAIIWDRILDICCFGLQYPLFVPCNHHFPMLYFGSSFHNDSMCKLIGTFHPCDQNSWLPNGHKTHILPITAKEIQFPDFVVIREGYFLFLLVHRWQDDGAGIVAAICERMGPEWGLNIRKAELRNPETEAPFQGNHLNLDQTIPEVRAPSGFFSFVSK